MASKYPSESELIVVAKPEAALRAAAPGTHMESVAPTTDRIARDSTSPILAAPSTCRAGGAR
jgi:hypothetical protein